MAQFYRINFTAKGQERKRFWSYGALLLLLGALAAGGGIVRNLFEESRKPVLQPRLTQYQTLADHAMSVLADWKKAVAAYREVQPYIEKEDQITPVDMLAALQGLIRTRAAAAPSGTPYCFLPVALTVSRLDGMTLKGVAPLPERDKSEHLQGLTAFVTNAFAAGVRSTNVSCQLTWKKAVPDAADTEIGGALKVSFATVKPRPFPPPPSELEAAVNAIGVWRDAVRKCPLAVSSGGKVKQPVGQLLQSLVSNNRQMLGGEYARVKALAEGAVDPKTVLDEMRKAAGGKAPAGLAAFEQAWNGLSRRRWRREATLDNPALDAAIAELARISEALPHAQDSLTNGVQKKHIVQEQTF